MYVQCRGNAHIHTNTHTCLTLGIVKQGENVLGARCNNNIHVITTFMHADRTIQNATLKHYDMLPS